MHCWIDKNDAEIRESDQRMLFQSKCQMIISLQCSQLSVFHPFCFKSPLKYPFCAILINLQQFFEQLLQTISIYFPIIYTMEVLNGLQNRLQILSLQLKNLLVVHSELFSILILQSVAFKIIDRGALSIPALLPFLQQGYLYLQHAATPPSQTIYPHFKFIDSMLISSLLSLQESSNAQCCQSSISFKPSFFSFMVKSCILHTFYLQFCHSDRLTEIGGMHIFQWRVKIVFDSQIIIARSIKRISKSHVPDIMRICSQQHIQSFFLSQSQLIIHFAICYEIVQCLNAKMYTTITSNPCVKLWYSIFSYLLPISNSSFFHLSNVDQFMVSDSY